MKKRMLIGLSVVGCLTVLGSEGGEGLRGERRLSALPAGAVKPRGWLKDRAGAAAKGTIGHIEKLRADIDLAWTPDFCLTGKDLYWMKPAKGWPFEGASYWFEGLVRFALQMDDPELIGIAARKMETVTSHVNDKGVGFLWWLPREKGLEQIPPDGGRWVLSGHACVARALSAWQRARPAPEQAKALADAYNFDFGMIEGGWGGMPPQAAVEVYSCTGDKTVASYLDRFYDNVRAHRYAALYRPVPAQWMRLKRDETPLHGVTFLENLTATLYGYLWTGDRAFLDNSKGWMDGMAAVSLQPMGIFGMDEYFRPAGAYVGTETCAVAAQEWLMLHLLSIEGLGFWGDWIEQLFYNAGEGAFSHDYCRSFVLQYPNRISPRGDYDRFLPCPASGCCTSNGTRIMPGFIQYLWMSDADKGLVATLYAPSTVTAKVADSAEVTIDTETDYPFGDTLTFRVSVDRPVAFPLSFRIPSWCDKPELMVNGAKIKPDIRDGFAKISRQWTTGDVVGLVLPSEPRIVVHADTTDPRRHFGGSEGEPNFYNAENWLDDQDFSRCAQSVSVHLGPLCLALPIPKLDKYGNDSDPVAKWKYALDPAQLNAVVRRTSKSVEVSVDAIAAEWPHDPEAPRLPLEMEIRPIGRERIRLLPFASSPFHITQFPRLRQKIASTAKAVEPVRWFDGSWDKEGKPRGCLLTDNPMWFGPRVFTGVSYQWEVPPTGPLDIRGEDRQKPAQRLIGGRTRIVEWDTVGRPGDKPMVAIFDFKRPCAFTEIDLVSERCTNAMVTMEFSADRVMWRQLVRREVTGAITRLKFDLPRAGRYMRLSFQALPSAHTDWGNLPDGYTLLDEVIAWGSAEVSERYPEDVQTIPAGDSLTFTNITKGTVSILPMPIPHLSRKPSGGTPGSVSLMMARNETESRYFAVVNGGSEPTEISLAAPDFGKGIASELLIGGVLRVSPPKRKLSETEMVQLHTDDRDGINKGNAEDLDVLPFFHPHATLPSNCLRKYLANPQQVEGFPDAVRLAPGEGCVVMLRVRTDKAAPGIRRGVFSAGQAKLPVAVDIIDLLLPPQSMWIYAYEPFTWQFPYESGKRVMRDVQRYIDIGATTTRLLPVNGSKEHAFFRRVPNASVGYYIGEEKSIKPVMDKVGKGKFEEVSERELNAMTEGLAALYRRAKDLGLKREQLIAFLTDEPCPGNARSVMQMAARIKKDVPEAVLHCDPLCYGKDGFCPSDEIINLFKPEYLTCVDVSCPIDCLTGRPELMKELWGTKRTVNAQYNHPAGRTGTHMAYDCYRKGFNGFAYYCYYFPNGSDPWDIRTWGVLNYSYQAVFPLEEDVALTPLYEYLREGAETCRLLDAVKAAGKTKLYEEVLERSKSAWDRTHFQYDLQDDSKEDILVLRDLMLKSFK